MSLIFKNLVQVEVQKHLKTTLKGRPQTLSFNDAFDDICHVIKTGLQWRCLRPKDVSFITVFKRMHTWISLNVFEEAYKKLLKLYKKKYPPEYYCIDSSYIKNIYGKDCVGKNPTDRGRKATKLSVIVDEKGVPHSLHASEGNVSDMKLMCQI